MKGVAVISWTRQENDRRFIFQEKISEVFTKKYADKSVEKAGLRTHFVENKLFKFKQKKILNWKVKKLWLELLQ